MAEAYRLLRHIDSLYCFLRATRAAYLNIGGKRLRGPDGLASRLTSSGQNHALVTSLNRLTQTGHPHAPLPGLSSTTTGGSIDEQPAGSTTAADGQSAGGELRAEDITQLLHQLKHSALTDAQRDDMDQQSKFIIRQCLERIKRLEHYAKNPPEDPAQHSTKSFLGLFTLSLGSQYNMLKQETLAAHHGAVLWLLNKRLMDVSMYQREQQETRLNRALERQQSLQPRRTYWAKKQADSPHPSHAESIPGRLGASTPNSIPASLKSITPSSPPSILRQRTPFTQRNDTARSETKPKSSVASTPSTPQPHDVIDDYWGHSSSFLDTDDQHTNPDSEATDAALTGQQMELQAENQALLDEFEDTLTQVRTAEQALLEISALQSTLTSHLAIQTEETERLHSEAVATSERVQEGNEQLLQARQRNADTRKWILMFLIAASLVLLFLDWFD
ncbi:hypothetical protein BJ085DRAFT_15317 [Dimargaris cristalligena]|uniref:t-SNARE coiled-coil homology domain-containing protein n=1 Tax=Dimargaris cristalligena TaxID=215637 RepID=A0A4P9ZNU8_9FUNG|nr:hypothetical protein BJ085DRAFT_15317 [Dimargaris cristalligena]|eukprot:RKP34000.1 hypothetical protein BJ085DRAFT_15317 [Dimargaris cristalligena]